jgi:hypothetical protein
MAAVQGSDGSRRAARGDDLQRTINIQASIGRKREPLDDRERTSAWRGWAVPRRPRPI